MGLLRRFLGLAGSEDAPSSRDRSCSDHSGTRNDRPGERSVRNGRQAAVKPPQPLVAARRPARLPDDVHVNGCLARYEPARQAGQAGPATAPAGGQVPAAAAAPPPAPPAGGGPANAAEVQRGDVRFSSLPQALTPLGHQQRCLGSGPGAPVSPDPAAPPPVLRRVSSTPCSQPGLSHNSIASAHSSSTADESAAGMGPSGSSGSSKEGSRGRASASASLPAALPAAAAAAGSHGSRQACGDLPQWHPALGGVPSDQATPKWAQKPRREEEPEQAAGTVPSVRWPPQLSVNATGASAAGGVGDSPDSPFAAAAESPSVSSVRSVSLLTFLLRGPSAASSLAASREHSTRGGVKRQPGGLSLALSRENSLRGGARREDSVRSVQSERERSVREGSQRGNSARGGSQRAPGGRQEGSVLAQWGASPFGGLPSVPQQPRGCSEEPHPLAGGCGSGEWMGLAQGLPPVTELLGNPDAPCQGAASVGRAEEPSPPAVCPPAACAAPPTQTQEVGSWAKRVTTFPRRPSDIGTPLNHAGGPDPMLLSAALAALAGSPAAEPADSNPGHNVLVGDSELALTGSGDLPSPQQQGRQPGAGGRRGGSDAAGAASAAPASATAALMLSNSWHATRQVFELPPLVPLGGSAPTHGCSPCSRSPAPGMHFCSQPLVSEVTASDQEWNRSFMKRWRAVKKRAYLQALGLRALWKVNSLSDRHEPVELLTNDLPQCDNGMRRAWSVTRLAAQREQGQRGGATSLALPAGHRPASSAPLHKDPSLAAMLLGEVAEVC